MPKGPDVWVVLVPEDMRVLNRGGSIGKQVGDDYVRISYFDEAEQQKIEDVELPQEGSH